MEYKIDSQKEKTDVLFKLEECSWKEYERRHRSEWQINFSLWAGLAIMTGFSIKEKYNDFPWWIVLIIFIIIVAVYFHFRYGMFKSNRIDQDRRFYYLKEIHGIIDVNLPDKKYEEVHGTSIKDFLNNWSHCSQIAMTILFLFIAFLALTGILS